MKEPITIGKLKDYGFNSEIIEDFKNGKVINHTLIKGAEIYWAYSATNSILSGNPAARSHYFKSPLVIAFPFTHVDLIPEYFKKSFQMYLDKRKIILGEKLNQINTFDKFKQEELQRTENSISESKEDLNVNVQLLSDLASRKLIVYEYYYEWLKKVEAANYIDKPTSIAQTLKPIDRQDYLHSVINDDEVMTYYEKCLKHANQKLSLNTKIGEMPNIFNIYSDWADVLNYRLENSFNKELAITKFKQELEELVEIKDDPKFFNNKYRKISYDFHCSGQPIILKGLGYLIIRNKWQLIEGENTIVGYTNFFDTKAILTSIAEGVAIAEYLHGKFDDDLLLLSFSIGKKPNTVVNSKKTVNKSALIEGFKDIFIDSNWEIYITALEKTTPPLLSSDWKFIGSRKKHKGVICGWIYELKNRGIIKQNYSRSQLAKILNAELKDFNMGLDGKTFDNISKEYTEIFQQQLLNITK